MVAGRLDPAHDLGDDGDGRVVADRGEVGGEDAVRGRARAAPSPGSRTSARTTRRRCPVARSMSSAFSVEEPVDGRADGAVAEQGYGDVNWGRHVPPRRGAPRGRASSRSSPPTDSTGWRAAMRRSAVIRGLPASSSAISSRAKEPLRMSSRSCLMFVLTCSSMTTLAARQVAVLGHVGDRVAHVPEAALVDEVDDELELVDALVVGDLGLVARVDEDLEAGLHQRGDAAAEDGLLAEEVALGLLGERRLDHPRAAAADRGAVGERQVERAPARVLRDGDERRGARAGLEQLRGRGARAPSGRP